MTPGRANLLDTWDWRHHPSIHPSLHPLLGSGRGRAAGPFLPPLIRYVDPADFLSRDHCLLSINKRPLFSSDHWISLPLSANGGREEGSFLGQVTTNTAQKEKEDEKRTVRSWTDGRTDGWMGDVHQWKRARERERAMHESLSEMAGNEHDA